jgi:peroxiredoxin
VPRVQPRSPAPPLDLPLAGGGRFVLSEQSPEAFTLVVFYRGLHCPKCKDQLAELDTMLERFAEVGVTSVVAVSGDTQERADRTVSEWGLSSVPVAHGLTEEAMRDWDLYVSKGVKEPEPDVFNEPGMFLVRADGTVYSAQVQSMPFARPHLSNLVNAVRWIREQDYPARGEA